MATSLEQFLAQPSSDTPLENKASISKTSSGRNYVKIVKEAIKNSAKKNLEIYKELL